MAFSKGKAVEAANKAMKKGQYAKAITEYQRIVKHDPADIRANLKLGDLHIRAGQTDEAIKVLRDVADHYSKQGFTLKAVAVFKQILKLAPGAADISVALAAHLQQQGLLSEAVRQYKEAAIIFGQRGQNLERLDVIRSMLELDGDNVSDRIRLAEAYSNAGRYNEAVALFRDACALLARRDRPQLYCKVAERLLHHQPDDFGINRQLATFYLKDRDAQRALPKLRACYRQQPRDLDVLDMLAETFELLGQPHKAVSVLREMARIYEENGLLKERDQTYERILLSNSSDSEARRALKIVSAVGEQSLVLEFEESAPNHVLPQLGDDEPFDSVDVLEEIEEISEVELDADALLEEASTPKAAPTAVAPKPAVKPKPAAKPKPRPVPAGDREDAPTDRDLSRVKSDPAAALAAVRSGDSSLEEIFGDLDLDEEIDIQDDSEDTVVVGDFAIEDFDEFDLDDEIRKAAEEASAPAPAAAPTQRGGELEDDWKALFGDDDSGAGAGTDRDRDAFGKVEEDAVDLDALMKEADQALFGGDEPAATPKPRPAAKKPAAAPAPAPAPAAGMDVALRESLEEVDFYVSNELNEDAVQLLKELEGEYPKHPEIVRRLQQLG